MRAPASQSGASGADGFRQPIKRAAGRNISPRQRQEKGERRERLAGPVTAVSFFCSTRPMSTRREMMNQAPKRSQGKKREKDGADGSPFFGQAPLYMCNYIWTFSYRYMTMAVS